MTRWDCSEEQLLPLFAKGRIHSIDGRVIAKPAAEPKKNKYSAVKTDVNGELCDSKKEAGYYEQLLWLQRAGEIKEIKTQFKILLQPGRDLGGGKTIKPIYYIADFYVVDKDDHVFVVDTKGKRTQVYLLKKKLLLYTYPGIDFREV